MAWYQSSYLSWENDTNPPDVRSIMSNICCAVNERQSAVGVTPTAYSGGIGANPVPSDFIGLSLDEACTIVRDETVSILVALAPEYVLNNPSYPKSYPPSGFTGVKRWQNFDLLEWLHDFVVAYRYIIPDTTVHVTGAGYYWHQLFYQYTEWTNNQYAIPPDGSRIDSNYENGPYDFTTISWPSLPGELVSVEGGVAGRIIIPTEPNTGAEAVVVNHCLTTGAINVTYNGNTVGVGADWNGLYEESSITSMAAEWPPTIAAPVYTYAFADPVTTGYATYEFQWPDLSYFQQSWTYRGAYVRLSAGAIATCTTPTGVITDINSTFVYPGSA